MVNNQQQSAIIGGPQAKYQYETSYAKTFMKSHSQKKNQLVE